jgi:hypothetical protein
MPDQAEGTAAWLWPQTQRLGLSLRIQPLGARLRMVQKSLSAGVEVEPFSARDADKAANLWPQTQRLDLSLALRIQLLR